jgi:hypothetical protein
MPLRKAGMNDSTAVSSDSVVTVALTVNTALESERPITKFSATPGNGSEGICERFFLFLPPHARSREGVGHGNFLNKKHEMKLDFEDKTKICECVLLFRLVQTPTLLRYYKYTRMKKSRKEEKTNRKKKKKK